MVLRWLALVGPSCACAASTPNREAGETDSAAWMEGGDASDCEDAGDDHCLAPACTGGVCALYRCEDLKPGKVVRTRGSHLPGRPPPDSRRYWGNARGLPGDGAPMLVINIHYLSSSCICFREGDCLLPAPLLPCSLCGWEGMRWYPNAWVDASSLPTDLDVFRLEDNPMQVLASERFVEAARSCGVSDVVFTEVATAPPVKLARG